MRASVSSFLRLSRQVAVLMLLLFMAAVAYSQITPSQDTYTNTANPTTNYGVGVALGVVNSAASIQTTYIQFDLSSIPAGYKSSNLSKATLKLYVNTVPTAGSFNIDFVNGTWAEKKVTANLAPALGTTIVASVPLTSANVKNYLLLDITSAVGAWLDGTQANDGIALVANSSLSATFDSKENTAQSHPPEIDIVFAGIAGVATASGSGLIGGGTSGTLNLSLTNTCAANQILQWNGTAWVCANLGAGGTVTSVGLTVPSTDFLVTGSPVTTSGTLGLGWITAPDYNNTPNAIVKRDNSGNFSAGAINAASGFNLGGNPFASGSYAYLNAFLGFAGNTTMTGTANTASGYKALLNNTTGSGNTAIGTYALINNITGAGNTASGSYALYSNTASSNTADGYQALYNNTAGGYNTATGYQALDSNTTGSYNTATGYQALINNTTYSNNTAYGYQAMYSNSTGGANTATGVNALRANLSGNNNLADGLGALQSNTSGSQNTGVGYTALSKVTTGTFNTGLGYSAQLGSNGLTNATAIGAYAQVNQSNSLVLGSINGVNGASNNVRVGIGITSPVSYLHVLAPGATIGNIGSDDAIVGECGAVDCVAIEGASTSPTGGEGVGAFATGTNAVALYAGASGNATVAGYFEGNVAITGQLTKGSGSFKIDHPLDPANKYLYHSFVESPDMMNIYNGVVTLDAHGTAWIALPDYFGALNKEFRYQLTSLGRPQPSLYIAREISNNRFRIAGGKPGGRVSWQVTGIRQDVYANAHRIAVEEVKSPQEQGRYLHPELFGAGPEKAVGVRAPEPSTGTPAQTAALTPAKGATQQH